MLFLLSLAHASDPSVCASAPLSITRIGGDDAILVFVTLYGNDNTQIGTTVRMVAGNSCWAISIPKLPEGTTSYTIDVHAPGAAWTMMSGSQYSARKKIFTIEETIGSFDLEVRFTP